MIGALALGLLSMQRLDREYLAGLARDTWRCIAKMEAPSGLPYDNSDRGEYTSVSNIGIYLSCVVGAEKLKLISHAEAIERVQRTLSATKNLRPTSVFSNLGIR